MSLEVGILGLVATLRRASVGSLSVRGFQLALGVCSDGFEVVGSAAVEVEKLRKSSGVQDGKLAFHFGCDDGPVLGFLEANEDLVAGLNGRDLGGASGATDQAETGIVAGQQQVVIALVCMDMTEIMHLFLAVELADIGDGAVVAVALVVVKGDFGVKLGHAVTHDDGCFGCRKFLLPAGEKIVKHGVTSRYSIWHFSAAP